MRDGRHEVLQNRELLELTGQLERAHHAGPRAFVRGHRGDVATLVEDLSARWGERTREHREGRRLASTVGSDEAGEPCPPKLDGDVRDHRHAVEGPSQPHGREDDPVVARVTLEPQQFTEVHVFEIAKVDEGVGFTARGDRNWG